LGLPTPQKKRRARARGTFFFFDFFLIDFPNTQKISITGTFFLKKDLLF
jgi:hypothetical protein